MLQYVSYQVHITFFCLTVISGGGGVAGYREEGCQASGHSSRLCFTGILS